MRALTTAVVSGFALVATAASSPADVVTIEPLRDNTVFSEGETSNGAGANLFAGNTARGNTRRALIAFDVAAAIPAGSVVESATLSLVVNRTRAGTVPVSLRRLTADWGEASSDAGGQEGGGAPAAEGDATWTRSFFDTLSWTTPGGDLAPAASATVSVGDGGPYTWGPSADMTADVQGWLDAPETAFGWALVGDESRSGTAKRFASREHGATDSRPSLTIEFRAPVAGTPTPTRRPTPTVTPVVALPCPGDCSEDGQVTVDELVRAVNIALGNADTSICPAADRNSDAAVTIDELVAATGASLTGCP